MVALLLLPPQPFLTSCFLPVGWELQLVPYLLVLLIFPVAFPLTPAMFLVVFAAVNCWIVLLSLLAPSDLAAPLLLLAPSELMTPA